MSNAKPTIVFYPFGGISHLTPSIELAKLFTNYNLNAIILLIDSPPDPKISSLISTTSSSFPSISFHHLPPSPPSNPSSDHLLLSFQLLQLNNTHLHSYLSQLSQSTPVSALILDFFCTVALGVAKQLQIPSYFFYSASATGLNSLTHLPKLIAETPTPLKDLGDSPLHFPGLPPVPASHVPGHFLDPNGPFFSLFVSLYETLPKADGIIVNTFEELEKGPIDALAAETEFPPIYSVGPLPLAASGSDGGERHACLTWLDAQPKQSVVFLCFGSMGTFPRVQLVEIAAGLEGSGQRFLWVVRSPPGEDPNQELEAFLPEGFLERTKEKGIVLKGWAPQTAVLGHESVGAFVSHCGWNSVLEAVSVGVPIIAWPLYAEQRLNKVYLVEAAKLAVELRGYDKEVVKGKELEEKVKWLMETEEGEKVKERVRVMKENAVAATKEGGSSDKAWKELVKAIKKEN